MPFGQPDDKIAEVMILRQEETAVDHREKKCVSALQNWIVGFCLLLTLAPILASFTVRPFYYLFQGDIGQGRCTVLELGEYWGNIVYFLGACLLVCTVLGAGKRYSGHLGCLREKGWLSRHWLPCCLLCLLLWSVLSFCFADDKMAGLWGAHLCQEGLILFSYYGAIFLACSWLTGKQRRLLCESLVLTGAFTGILLILGGNPTVQRIFYIEYPETVMFHQYNHYGYFLAVCAPLSLGLLLETDARRKGLWLWRLLQLWLIFNAMAFNSTRGSFLAVALEILCLHIYVFTCRKEKRLALLLLDLPVVATFLFLNTGSILLDRLGLMLKELLGFASAPDKEEALNQLGTERGMLWRYGLEIVKKRPLLGFGPGNMMEQFRPYMKRPSSPHNDLILMAGSLGIPAVIFYVLGLLGHLRGFFSIAKKLSILEVSIFGAVLSYLISASLGVSMYYTTPYFYMVLGFSYGIYRENINSCKDCHTDG